MKNTICLLLLCICFSGLLGEDIPEIGLRLADVETAVLRVSPELKAAEFQAQARYERASQIRTSIYPKLSLDGYYRYIQVVPEIEFGAQGMPPRKLGDNRNYSIGPGIYWLLWDGGGVKRMWLSASSAYEAKIEEKLVIERQILLNARTAYINLALAAEQVVLLADALKLAQAQYDDITAGANAGAKSRKDELLAHQELIFKQKQFRQSRADMAVALEYLYSLMGNGDVSYLRIPLDSRLKNTMPKSITRPSCFADIEPLEKVVERFERSRNIILWEAHPKIKLFDELVESASYAALSARSGLWPVLAVSGRSSIDYPNGPKLESFNQNSAAVYLSWPLFESNLTAKKIKENESMRSAYLNRKEASTRDLKREWHNAKSELENLSEQDELNMQALKKADELAAIVFAAYKSGAAVFLEVQDANYKALEIKMQSAYTKARILTNLAVLAGLGETEDKNEN